jgi:hypothetical protein
VSPGLGRTNEPISRHEPVADDARRTVADKGSRHLRARGLGVSVAPEHLVLLLVVAIVGLYLVRATLPVSVAVVQSAAATRAGPSIGQQSALPPAPGSAPPQAPAFRGLPPQAPVGPPPQPAPFGASPQAPGGPSLGPR